jgi:hypothetical protein
MPNGCFFKSLPVSLLILIPALRGLRAYLKLKRPPFIRRLSISTISPFCFRVVPYERCATRNTSGLDVCLDLFVSIMRIYRRCNSRITYQLRVL